MDKETIISSIANTSCTANVSAQASTFSLTSATGWDSPDAGNTNWLYAPGQIGAGYFRNGRQMFDFFTYQTNTAGVLSGVSGLDQAHPAKEECHKCYILPSDFGYPRALYKSSVYLKYHKADAALRQVPAHPFYTIKRLADDSYSGLFLVLPYKIGVFDWNLQYQRSPVEIENAADPTLVKLDLPRGHGRRYYIEKLKAYIYDNEGEDMDRQVAEQKANEHIEALLDEYGIEEMSGDAPGLVLGDW